NLSKSVTNRLLCLLSLNGGTVDFTKCLKRTFSKFFSVHFQNVLLKQKLFSVLVAWNLKFEGKCNLRRPDFGRGAPVELLYPSEPAVFEEFRKRTLRKLIGIFFD